MTQAERSSTANVFDQTPRATWRFLLPVVSALVTGMAAPCLAATPTLTQKGVTPIVAPAVCPSTEDGFYVRVVVDGEGATKTQSRRAAEIELVDRVSFLSDSLGMDHSRTIVVALTNITTTSQGGSDLTITTAASWLFVNESTLTVSSVRDGCQGPKTSGVIQEYDMDKYWN